MGHKAECNRSASMIEGMLTDELFIAKPSNPDIVLVMSTKWRVFTNADLDTALGIKVQRDGGLWMPTIVAINTSDDYLRLDGVTTLTPNKLKIIGTKATVTVRYDVQVELPLTPHDLRAKVRDEVLVEDLDLRAQINYTKRGNWYKITPR